jgi:hypothetical protein
VRFLALTPITHASGAMIMPVLLKSGTYAMTQGFTPEKFVPPGRAAPHHRHLPGADHDLRAAGQPGAPGSRPVEPATGDLRREHRCRRRG